MQTNALQFQGRRKLQRTIDMTPLIDVVFQLLLFFMLTSAIVVNQGIDLNIPESTQVSTLPTQSIEIEISKKENLYVSGKQVSIEKLVDYLVMTQESPSKVHAIVKSDAEVSVETLVRVMDGIKLSGITNISLAANKATLPKKN